MEGLTMRGRAMLVAVVIAASAAGSADAHRPIGWEKAQRYANRQVRHDACGKGKWSCLNVWVPLLKCGYHRYCWRGVSHEECRKFLGFCYKRRMRESAGNVNGHTGRTVVTAVW